MSRTSRLLDYAAPVSLGLAMWLWACRLPYTDRLIRARLGAAT